jgi:hypothetical protein
MRKALIVDGFVMMTFTKDILREKLEMVRVLPAANGYMRRIVGCAAG